MDSLYKIYYSIPSMRFLGWFSIAMDRVLTLALTSIANKYWTKKLSKETYELNTEKRGRKVIFSLTTYPARIDTIWITLRTLFRQKVKADRIILWLADSQFPNRRLPEQLLELCKFGLEIRWCEDIRSHKKYHFALREFPDDLILTFDDDFFYPNNVSESLLKLYCTDNRAICGTRAHRMRFDEFQKLKPYKEWDYMYIGNKADNLFFTSGAGTLFPPGSLHLDVLDSQTAMDICKFADDVWLNVMAHRLNTRILINNSFNKDMILIRGSQQTNLCSTNVNEGGNDEQIKKVCKHYNFTFK